MKPTHPDTSTTELTMSDEEKVARIKRCIGYHRHFPDPDTGFRDVFPVLGNPAVFKDLIDLIVKALREEWPDIECVAGLESRGYLIGTPVAKALNIPFIPLRKKGKLGGELLSIDYEFEQGLETFELQKSSITPGQKMVLMDDMIATGRTMTAAWSLLEKAGAVPSLVLSVIELKYLHGREAIGRPMLSIVTFESTDRDS